jgi:hypothetical protein
MAFGLFWFISRNVLYGVGVGRIEKICLGGQSEFQICGISKVDFLKFHNRSP